MLNPLRASLIRAGQEAQRQATPFAERADAEIAHFQSLRDDLVRQVRRGDLTVKVARERASAAAEGAKTALKRQADGFSPTPRAYLDRLIETTAARKLARENASLESLQRETNRLLRESVVEMRLVARAAEFEAKTFVRPMTGGVPAPTLDGLLALARSSGEAGDEVASEWSRRQLEAIRAQVSEPSDLRRIDLATDRPDVVNTRLVESYLAAMEGQPREALRTFIYQSIESGDANACVAAFALVRQFPTTSDDPLAVEVTRQVLTNLSRFPDAALTTLRGWEADARQFDTEAAQAQVEFAAARLDAESRLPGLENPTNAEVDRSSRIEAKPLVLPGEAIGLTLARRGQLPGDFGPSAITEIDQEPATLDDPTNSFLI